MENITVIDNSSILKSGNLLVKINSWWLTAPKKWDFDKDLGFEYDEDQEVKLELEIRITDYDFDDDGFDELDYEIEDVRIVKSGDRTLDEINKKLMKMGWFVDIKQIEESQEINDEISSYISRNIQKSTRGYLKPQIKFHTLNLMDYQKEAI